MHTPNEIKKPEEQGLISALIWMIYLPGFLYSVAQGMIVPVLPLFSKNLTESFQLIGWVLAADFLGQVLSDIPTGYIMERIGRKRGMIVGLLIVAVTTGLIFWSTTIWHLFLLRFLSGFGNALYSVSRHAWLADEVAVNTRGRALAVIGGVGRGGRVVGPIIGGTVAVTFGQRPTFLLYALIVLLPVLVLAFTKERGGASQERKSSKHENDFVSILQNHWTVLLPAGAGAFFAQMIRSARTVVLPLFAAVVLELDARQIGTILSVSSLIDTVLFPAAGILMDRFGRKYAIVPSFVLQGIGVFLIALATGYWGLMVAAVFIGLGNGISAGTMMTLGADLSPADSRGGFLGLWRLIGDAGFMTAPLIVGAIADALTLGTATMVLAFSGGIASVIFMWFVPETLKKTPVSTRQ
ncbi:MAG: MFS family permease [Candidatus Promineifilaceae bacterium]|jgi:MFS family permease